MNLFTPIGARLQMALDAEYLRMQNEWFFKWHYIKGNKPVRIDGFDGRTISYCGIAFSGTARDVFWATIQRYARQKISQLLDQLEADLKGYHVEIRMKALQEAQSLIIAFAEKIRESTIEKDRVLRGNGHKFPPRQDMGRWDGALRSDVQSRVATLRHIYCDLEIAKGENQLVLRDLLRDKVTLVKADGKIVRENIQAQVSSGRIITLDSDLPVEPGDHFLRAIPSGLVEDYVIDDPNFITGIGGIPASFQSKVHRGTEAAAPKQQVLQAITNNFYGANSRVTFGTDNSVNLVKQLDPLSVAKLVEQIKPHVGSLPEPQRTEIAAPLEALEAEIKSGSAEPSAMQRALRSIQTIMEGASGSLIAAGIQAMIANLI